MKHGGGRTQVIHGVVQGAGVGLVQQRLAHHVFDAKLGGLVHLCVEALVEACRAAQDVVKADQGCERGVCRAALPGRRRGVELLLEGGRKPRGTAKPPV